LILILPEIGYNNPEGKMQRGKPAPLHLLLLLGVQKNVHRQGVAKIFTFGRASKTRARAKQNQRALEDALQSELRSQFAVLDKRLPIALRRIVGSGLKCRKADQPIRPLNGIPVLKRLRLPAKTKGSVANASVRAKTFLRQRREQLLKDLLITASTGKVRFLPSVVSIVRVLCSRRTRPLESA
jgi:hypothetical protein